MKAARALLSHRDHLLSKSNLSVTSASVLHHCASWFERAAAILTELCVGGRLDSTMETKMNKKKKNSMTNTWVIASAPARIDISRGWSDTPPISYEFGEAVACMAVKVDDCKPLSARCRHTNKKSGGIHLVTELRSAVSGNIVEQEQVHIHHVGDLLDFHNPTSTAALLKAALIYLGLIPQELILSNHDDDDDDDSKNDLSSLSCSLDKMSIEPFLKAFLNVHINENENEYEYEYEYDPGKLQNLVRPPKFYR